MHALVHDVFLLFARLASNGLRVLDRSKLKHILAFVFGLTLMDMILCLKQGCKLVLELQGKKSTIKNEL
jgi:hypothetical protein